VENFEAPFLTFTNSPNDSNYLGEIEEIAALNRRVEQLDLCLRTGKEFDVLLDTIEEDGQDATTYVESVGNNLSLIYASHLVPEDWAIWQKEFS
jgi:hypothetical protein